VATKVWTSPLASVTASVTLEPGATLVVPVIVGVLSLLAPRRR
jgi:hypothetical protein